MGKLEVNQFVINLRILKQCYFYHIFDPNSTKILNRNVYRLLCIVFIAFNLCVLLLGYVGMFTNKDDTLSDLDLLQLMLLYTYIYLSLVKICVILYKANVVWDLFDVVRLDFLKSKLCRKNINMLYSGRDLIIKAGNYFILVIVMIYIQWVLLPLVLNAFDDTVNRRNQNAINIPFPVSIHTYNQYFVMFYVIEVIVISFARFTLIVIDMLIWSFCYVIIILYQMLTKSFAEIGYANKSNSGKKNKSCVNE